MDSALFYANTYFFTPYIYPTFVSEDNIKRQITSLYLIACSSTLFLYVIVAAINYYFFFDHQVMQHPLFGKNQLLREIKHSCSAIAVLSFLSIPFIYVLANGQTNLRENYDTALLGWFSTIPEITVCLLFVDIFSYGAHRLAHHKYVYKHIHKQHHSYKVTTPFASHAFHPIDGLMQVLPYYLCGIFVPIQKHVFLGVMVFGNVWAVFIHDGEIQLPSWTEKYINGARHHADHHLTFKYNYGQFLTFWDRKFGSFKEPSPHSTDNTDEQQETKGMTNDRNVTIKSRRKVHSLDMHDQLCDWSNIGKDGPIDDQLCDDVFIENDKTIKSSMNNFTKELYIHFLENQRNLSCCGPQYYCQTLSLIQQRQRAHSTR
ncbi:lathosterol oxidase-like [Antedon mediterranea]|uniref:lathosterol oxidase-like n=1 Tax=Antedon mediterranea TaxID=105859 RepID=UPI003AF9CA1B